MTGEHELLDERAYFTSDSRDSKYHDGWRGMGVSWEEVPS
jgi:hypothetical protein